MNWDRRQFSIILIVAITSFMGTFLISSVNIALPAIEKNFKLDAISLSWVVTAFLLATAMFLLPVGRIADLTGVRKVFKIGVIIFTIFSLLSGISAHGHWLIAFRFLQGIGGALLSTTGPAILVSAFPPQQRGRVLGISVSAVYLGLAMGPFAGGILTQYLGWRAIFYTAFVLGLFTTIIAFRFLGEDIKADRKPTKISFLGTVFYMVGLVALVYGSSRIPNISGWIIMGLGILSVLLFLYLENRSNYPVIDIKLYAHNRLFTFSNLAALINYSATFAIVFLLSLYLQKIKALSPGDAGLILISQPVVMALFSPVAGSLSDRIPARFLASLGMLLCTIGLFAFSFLTAATPIWLIVIVLVIVGFGFALFSSPNMNTIMSSVDKSKYGLASGSAATMRVVGQIISMTIATLVIAGLVGNQSIEDSSDELFMKVVRLGFICFTLLSIPGIYFSFSRETK